MVYCRLDIRLLVHRQDSSIDHWNRDVRGQRWRGRESSCVFAWGHSWTLMETWRIDAYLSRIWLRLKSFVMSCEPNQPRSQSWGTLIKNMMMKCVRTLLLCLIILPQRKFGSQVDVNRSCNLQPGTGITLSWQIVHYFLSCNNRHHHSFWTLHLSEVKHNDDSYVSERCVCNYHSLQKRPLSVSHAGSREWGVWYQTRLFQQRWMKFSRGEHLQLGNEEHITVIF